MGTVCGKAEKDVHVGNMDSKKSSVEHASAQPGSPTEGQEGSAPATQSEQDRGGKIVASPTAASSSDGETEEVGQVVYMGYCMVENYISNWVVELHAYPVSDKLRLTLHSDEETHKTFPSVIDLSNLVEVTIDQTKVTIRFPKKRLVLFFETVEESKEFVFHFPSHKMSRLLFSEVAIFCGPQKKALVQLVTFGKAKRFVGKRHGAALLIKTEKAELKHPILSTTTCSSQVRLVGVDEQTEHAIMLRFVTVGMAQTFIRKFSEIIHDMYAVDFILLYSGIVTHNGKTKKIELKQFDNGQTELSIFLRKERTINFSDLPTYRQNDLELIITSQSENLSLVFRTPEEIENFTQYLSPGLE